MPSFFDQRIHADRMKDRTPRARYIFIGMIAASGMVAYLNAVHADFCVLDDVSIIDKLQTTSRSVGDIFHASGGAYYRPLIAISFLFDLFLFGRDPAALHLVNIVIHILNGLLVYSLALILLKNDSQRDIYAGIAALFFVLHPLNSEAVVWIAARTDLLCSFFFLLTLLLLVERGHRADVFTLAGLFCMFLFSLFAKETSIVLLAIAPLYYFMKKDEIPRRDAVLATMALVSAGLLYFFLRSGKFGVVDSGISRVVTNSGSAGSSVPDALSAYGFYLRKLLYPFPLNFATITIHKALSTVFLFLCLPAAVLLFHRNRNLRLPLLIVLFGIIPAVLAFLGKLAWTPYAERYLYLPMIGFSIVIAMALSTYGRRVPPVMVVPLILLLAIPTISRTVVWSEPIAFWRDAVVKSPDFHRAHISLAVSLMHEREYAEAEKHLKKAAALGFNKDFLWLNFAAVHYARGNFSQYEIMMLRAAEVSRKPTAIYLLLINTMMSADYGSQDRDHIYTKAIAYYVKAFNRDPAYIEGLYNAGKLCWVMGDAKCASRYLRAFLGHERDSAYKPFAAAILKKITAQAG